MNHHRVITAAVAAAASLLALSSTVSAQYSTPPAPTHRVHVAQTSVQVPAWQLTSKVAVQNVDYSPQPGWTILSYYAYPVSASGSTWAELAGQPADYSSDMFTQLHTASQSAAALIAAAKLPDAARASLSAALNNASSLYANYVSHVSSSLKSVRIVVRARGNGPYVGTGSYIEYALDTVEIPVLADTNSQAGWNRRIVDPVKRAIASWVAANPPADTSAGLTADSLTNELVNRLADRITGRKQQPDQPVLPTQTDQINQPLFSADDANALYGQVAQELAGWAPCFTNGNELLDYIQTLAPDVDLSTARNAIPNLPAATARISIITPAMLQNAQPPGTGQPVYVQPRVNQR